MRQKLVLGNWKMNGDQATITALLQALVLYRPQKLAARVAVLPPYPYLRLVQNALANTWLCWGAQNLYPAQSGAYTGEVSGPMLKELGCQYVLVGHSERRWLLGESENFVAEKFHHAKEHGIIPVLCVGETLEERQQGLTEQVIARQLQAVVDGHSDVFNECVVAYEPVWAIGSGKTATPEEAQTTHAFIREWIAENSSRDEAMALPLLYGGSVSEKNASALFSMPDVDGGLIGGASLHASQFLEIVKCIN